MASINDVETQETLKGEIKYLRENEGLSQYIMADRLGVAQSTYSDLEQGPTRVRKKDLLAVASALDMAPDKAFPSVFGPESTVTA
jgi:transcriptional regulator with XRE-family HTH domain